MPRCCCVTVTSGLVYFGYRFYIPNTGRWLNQALLQEAKSHVKLQATWQSNKYPHTNMFNLADGDCECN